MQFQHNTVYLDYQATTPIDPVVIEAMNRCCAGNWANPHSDHAMGWQASKAVDEAANDIGKLIGCDADEVIFTSGSTEANNLALFGLARWGLKQNKKKIIISSVEHKSIIAPCYALKNHFGVEILSIPVDKYGFIDLDYLSKYASKDVLLASIIAVNNEIGTIQPIKAISSILRKEGILFHSDATQAPCAINILDIIKEIDLISLSSHKMYGPKGIGALFIRRNLQKNVEPIIHGGGHQNNLRSGTIPVPLCVGFGIAAKTLQHPLIINEFNRIRGLRDIFINKLLESDYKIYLNGPLNDYRHPGNTNLQFTGYSSDEILNSLQPIVAASSGSACTSGIQESSHVLGAIGLSQNQAKSSIRFSMGRLTTVEEIHQSINQILITLESLKGI